LTNKIYKNYLSFEKYNEVGSLNYLIHLIHPLGCYASNVPCSLHDDDTISYIMFASNSIEVSNVLTICVNVFLRFLTQSC